MAATATAPDIVPPAPVAHAPFPEVAALARVLFAQKMASTIAAGKTIDHIAKKCFEEARAFLAVEREQRG